MEELDIIKEFLIESDENLSRLDQEIIELEKQPSSAELIASIFRTIHTIKGTCGFLGFNVLTEVSHSAESILSQVRDRKRVATKSLINIILESIDAIKQILQIIEATGNEGDRKYTELVHKLHVFADSDDNSTVVAEVVAPTFEEDHSGPEQSASAPQNKTLATTHITASKQVAETKPVNQPKPQEAASVESEQPTQNASRSEKTGAADSSIRVDVGLLDKLMNLVGELVLARNQVLQFSGRIEDGAFTATSQRLNLITSELQEGVMKTRMQPIGIIWSKFPRVVRDIAQSIGKQINLTMEGTETELDRTIIEAIKDPLTHIVRNSCDHGIERPDDRVAKGKAPIGRLSMRAFHEGGHVVIEISDDGAGLNPEKIKSKAVQKGLITAEHAARMNDREAINTIFLPGFSTAEQISNISGRGVGMDVVKTNIERIGGIVDLISGNGPGTTVKIKIPLTLAIIPGLVVTSGGERFVIPQVSLSELVRLEGPNGQRQIGKVHTTSVYRRRGKLLPLTYLCDLLGAAKGPNSSDVTNIVVLQAEGREFGLVVDDINDTQEIVVKPLGKHLKSLTAYSGATIMGDGKIALILDVLGIANRSGIVGEDSQPFAETSDKKDEPKVEELESILLFSAGAFSRVAIPLRKVARLEEIPNHTIERAAGTLVTQYRGQILQLMPLVSLLDPYARYEVAEGKVPVVVFTRDNGSFIGVIVDRVIDIVHEHISVRRHVRGPGLLGSAVIGKAVTDLLDVSAITRTEDPVYNDGNNLEDDLAALSAATENLETISAR